MDVHAYMQMVIVQMGIKYSQQREAEFSQVSAIRCPLKPPVTLYEQFLLWMRANIDQSELGDMGPLLLRDDVSIDFKVRTSTYAFVPVLQSMSVLSIPTASDAVARELSKRAGCDR